MRKKRGQSILEYVIVITAIVAAVIFAAGSYIGPAIKTALNNTAQSIMNSTEKLPGAKAK